MKYTKKKFLFLITILLMFSMVGCVVDKNPPTGMDAPDDVPMPAETHVIEDAPDEDAGLIEYAGWVGAYLDILAENRIDIENAMLFEITNAGPVAILDVFGDETPELLYIYSYEDPDFFFNDDYPVPCLAIKIFTFTESGGVESVFDSNIFFAAGGGNNYCVFLACNGELMLYRSTISGDSFAWGFWQIAPNQNFETCYDSLIYKNESDLAILFLMGTYDDEKPLYKKNGIEISKEEYNKAAEEIMDNISYIIFPGVGEAILSKEDLWKDITHFEKKGMAYTEAVAWLEAYIENNI